MYDQSFYGEGVVDGEGGSSERCLKWGGGGLGVLKVSLPLPPTDNFNHTQGFFFRNNCRDATEICHFRNALI